jgi:hypothetical protein
MFRNHYWFSQVILKPQGMELYRRFQQGLNVRSLYDAMSAEVKGLQDQSESVTARAEERIRWVPGLSPGRRNDNCSQPLRFVPRRRVNDKAEQDCHRCP